MNTLISFARRVLCGAALIASVGTALGQALPAKHLPTDQAAVALDRAAYRAATTDAQARAGGGQIDAAEQALTRVNHSRPGTAAWEMETAQRLLQIAEQLSRNGTVDKVPPLVNRAMQHLETAASKPQKPTEAANARALEGFIQEQFLGDRASALASYQAAATLDPKSKRAAENTARLKQALDELKSRRAGN